MKDEVTSGPVRRFCVLQYIASEGNQDRVDSPTVVALVTSSQDGEVMIRVHPKWEKIVLPMDQKYLEALYEDFGTRVKSDPEALFRQLSDLSVGPIVTREVGSDLAANPAYLGLMQWFQEI